MPSKLTRYGYQALKARAWIAWSQKITGNRVGNLTLDSLGFSVAPPWLMAG
jgi:hypothetical protein